MTLTEDLIESLSREAEPVSQKPAVVAEALPAPHPIEAAVGGIGLLLFITLLPAIILFLAVILLHAPSWR